MHSIFKNLEQDKKVYLASDFHLGAPNPDASLKRELKIIRWLDEIKSTAAGIILVGDIFDFWFEYKHVVPKGHVRFLGKLAELRDTGIPIIFFVGNHDLWMGDYFPHEFGVPVIYAPTTFYIADYKIHIAHGDGLGPGDKKFKFFKKVFTNRLAQWAFRWFHPDAGISLAKAWSDHSKANSIDPKLNGEEQWLITYCTDVENKEHHDYYIMGHRHVAGKYTIGEKAVYYNLGEWIKEGHYLEIAQNEVNLIEFEA